MSNPDWNPELYLTFNRERIQPSIDLVTRIHADNPKTIIDIGCGPGNSTQILAERWPKAKIVGIDNSPSMIEKAKKDYPLQEWRIVDAGKNTIEGTYDIVFSNAAIQWIPGHAKLMKKLQGLLTENGTLAIQVPMFWDMPLGKSILCIAEDHRWAATTKGVKDLFTIHDCGFYYDVLSKLFGKTDLWETHYMHQMESHSSILEMIRSTGLKPYLEVLQTDRDKSDFEQQVLQNISVDYPVHENGKIIFPFKRLFLLAQK
jgi:trans-aconitate 2-methyltransferase